MLPNNGNFTPGAGCEKSTRQFHARNDPRKNPHPFGSILWLGETWRVDYDSLFSKRAQHKFQFKISQKNAVGAQKGGRFISNHAKILTSNNHKTQRHQEFLSLCFGVLCAFFVEIQ
jgi:hypothetical protein